MKYLILYSKITATTRIVILIYAILNINRMKINRLPRSFEMDKTKSTVLDGSDEEVSKRLEELIKQYEAEEKEKERKD